MDFNEDYSFSRPYIVPGESILWKGKPGKGHLFTAQDIFLIPFSILWFGFAIFWEYSAISEGAPFFFCLFGVPFLCVGLYITVGRFFWTAYIRKHTAYVITNKKIIRKRGRRIDLMDGKTLPPIHIHAFQDGNGTIQFGQIWYRNYDRSGWNRNDGMFSMENIPNVARVHQILTTMDR